MLTVIRDRHIDQPNYPLENRMSDMSIILESIPDTSSEAREMELEMLEQP